LGLSQPNQREEHGHSSGATTPPPPREAPPSDDISLFFERPTLSRPQAKPDPKAKLNEESDLLLLDPAEKEESTEETEDVVVLRTAWSTLVQEVMGTEKQLGSFLNHASIFAFDSRTVFLGVPDDFHAKALRSERVKLTHRLTDLTGLRIDRIAFRIETSETDHDFTPESESSVRESLELLCENYPAVRSLVERFGGEIVW